MRSCGENAPGLPPFGGKCSNARRGSPATVNFNGSGSSGSLYTMAGTYSTSGSVNMNYSSSGVAASGPNVNISTSATSLYTFTGHGLTNGGYQLSELGSYGNGSYSLACMAYTGTGLAQQNFAMVGGDSASGNNYTAADTYVGGSYFQDNYNLSEVGIYTNGSWALGSFTEAEGSTSAASSSSTGSYTSSGGTIASTGTYISIQGTSATFGITGNGVYANGSFSFATFAADLDANASMYYEENRSDATYLSDHRIDNAVARVGADVGDLRRTFGAAETAQTSQRSQPSRQSLRRAAAPEYLGGRRAGGACF